MIDLHADLIVLDVDDTLYLERDYVHSGFGHVGRWCTQTYGIDGVGEVAWRLFEEGVRRTTLGDALAECGAPDDALGEAVEEYRSHSPVISMLPDASDFVARHPDASFAVVTDGPAVSQRAKCAALGLESFCSPVVVTAEWGTSKPDVAVFELAVGGRYVDPARTVYVADNPHKDFIGPLALGWQAVRVRRPLGLHALVATPPGVLEVESLEALR